jgi:hypothetical protein
MIFVIKVREIMKRVKKGLTNRAELSKIRKGEMKQKA